MTGLMTIMFDFPFDLIVPLSLLFIPVLPNLSEMITRSAELRACQPNGFFSLCSKKERDKYGPFRAKRRRQQHTRM
ncbi:hypothetical protein [Pseudoalteromonas sp. Of7M-16]|uniref:hypothetical protein n=1 Tax=Pseudoalteromonas sp. Of7M-16 TaxID=2917756 RepID=UPI001EF4A8AC|nr:hypothetical protein [Pseudoalteromonas sp. Of7M-16]MCG7547397.1 hypothetical protein [Pseudoalteromonas sp. Of7M-16]